MKDPNIEWYQDIVMSETAKALERNGFSTIVCPTVEVAREKILSLVPLKATVGSGGSTTLKELGTLEALKERGHVILVSSPGMKLDETIDIRRRALLSDVYIASPNAITRDGKLFFVDKIGNRSGAMTFGPKKVVAVAGRNKIVADEHTALYRVADLAGPANAKRLKLSTPCVATGLCISCDSPERICNIYLTLKKRPAYTDYTVILVNQELGY